MKRSGFVLMALVTIMATVVIPGATPSKYVQQAEAKRTREIVALNGADAMSAASATPEVAEAVLNGLPISFEVNHGQAPQDVKFLARVGGDQIQLRDAEIVLAFGRSGQAPIHMKLANASPASFATGLDELPGKVNQFMGNDESIWYTDIPTFAMVGYRSVYAGIDLIVRGRQGQLEYDFLVAPGSDPNDILLTFQGIDQIAIDRDGGLVLGISGEDVRHRKPFIYQEIGGERTTVDGGFVLRPSGGVGFDLGMYDSSVPLVIDPVIEYSATLIGSEQEEGLGIAVDHAGNAYVVGYTTSDSFGLGSFGGFSDAFVAKLDAAGNPLYTTYLGGAGWDFGERIAVDDAGSVYLVGGTDSADFPIWPSEPNFVAQRNLAGDYDAFVTKFGPSGDLAFSTYLGGPEFDSGYGIAVDTLGRVYVTGTTGSESGIAVTGAYQETYGGGTSDGFVSVLAADGASLEYSTYLGGLSSDWAKRITIDGGANPNIYVIGETTSDIGFPITAGAYQETYGGYIDVFVAALNRDDPASHLLYSTYLGGTNEERAGDIDLDPSGNVYVAGYVEHLNRAVTEVAFPTTIGAYDGTFGGGTWDAFVAKFALNSDGQNDLAYSTYLGGDGEDWGYGLAVNGSGEAHVTGFTHSTDFPSVNAVQDHDPGGSFDAFLVKVLADGSDLVYSTHLGGSGHDGGYAVALDPAGTAYVAGATETDAFVERVAPTPRNAIYVWRAPGLHGTPIDLDEAQRLADFAVAEGIGTIFYDNWGCGPVGAYNQIHCPNGLPDGAEHQAADDLIPILQVFHDHGLQVEALYTDKGGVALTVAYNEDAATPPDARFDAIRLNIEGGVDGGFPCEQTQPTTCTIAGAPVDDLDVYHESVAAAGTLPVYVSVGHSWTLTPQIQEIVAGVDVQVVQDNAAPYASVDGRAIEFLSSNEVCLGNELGKPVHVTIETQDVMAYILDASGNPALNPWNTFFEEGEGTMETTLAELDFAAEVLGRSYVPPCPHPTPRGIAYHFYRESYGSPILPKWATDADIDGISEGDGFQNGTSGVDTDVLDSSNDFSDIAQGGSTSGSIILRGHQNLMVADAVDAAAGIVITASYETNPKTEMAPEPATITLNGGDCTTSTQLSIDAGDQVIASCGSVTLDVVAGTVDAVFMGNDGTVATTSLGKGNKVTFEPAAFTFSAPAGNATPVVVIVGGEEFSIIPGEDVNIPPEIVAISGPTVPLSLGTLVDVEASFTDPGTVDVHTASWDWGDGSAEAGVIDLAGRAVSGSHTFTTPGVYSVTLTVIDDHGGTDVSTFEYIVIFDSTGKKIMGSGEVDDHNGDALDFGFQIKVKDDGGLSGDLEFDVGGEHEIELEETGFEHLWIFTDWAHAKGTGHLETGISVDWALTVVDGDLTVPEGPDLFRLKVTKAGLPSLVLYDSQTEAADYDLPTLGIDKGKLKIKMS